MSRRDQIRMTDDEVAAFLDAQRTIVLGSNGPDGHPHLVAMWFVVRDGVVQTWTYRTSQKAKNLARDPRASLLAEDGETYDQLRGVLIAADAEPIEDPDEVHAVGWDIAVRYGGGEPTDPEARQGLEAFTRDQAQKRVAHRFPPLSVSSWDHRKLGGAY